ncbi:MAG: FAD-dependent oxidoreductase [Candidatus Marinimicrobia bacterium]|nr:FAD-dependent oxidoreductase [Candidatus Neomarinimicrobiota bacterium]MBT3631198.1 FAD-dependent oxidoreductase [Candidatus Neomarinimicrobiota bacterium]MBT3824706.1 FAD-dependent oxidoreductase [Candidatus Neomarinimicrobiota bacterium]MBT4131630.1 FAD-dependent oxidoreductase [Candidatus Neomarinimicrobiota bacterium]MBT4296099.1 FAD-dependent oxidoreductase [Candidatus Neomarinimicrobiota bacterium]
MTDTYDVIVLGGGPAGLTAGIYLGRAKLKTLIINEGSIGGQMVLTHAIANYPGAKVDISGRDLSLDMKAQAKTFGCKIESNVEVTSMDLSGELKQIEIDDDEVFAAKAVIVATGGTPRSMGVPGETKFKGSGVSYCATCDGDFFEGKEIIVVGGGNSALEEAVSLTQYASKVTVIHQFDHFQATEHAVKIARENEKIAFIMESEIQAVLGDQTLTGVELMNMKTNQRSIVSTDGIFVFIGYVANTVALPGSLALNSRNEIVTDAAMMTNLDGVFAAGDVREKRYRQITTAVSDGTIAALSAIDFIQS